MKIDIYAGKRVLFKDDKGNGWRVGIINCGEAELTNRGLLIPIIPIEFAHVDPADNVFNLLIDINDIFLDVMPLEDWHKQYKEYFMTKEEYIKFIESEDFDKRNENAYVSDGEYVYYRINKFNESWINKQPFDYIVRYDS